MELIVREPAQTCKTLVGKFYFSDGTTGDFYVLCEPDDDTPEVEARNMSAYNQQLTEEWERLIDEGFKILNYLEEEPFPLY